MGPYQKTDRPVNSSKSPEVHLVIMTKMDTDGRVERPRTRTAVKIARFFNSYRFLHLGHSLFSFLDFKYFRFNNFLVL